MVLGYSGKGEKIMRFELNLGRHCIETALKRLHNRLVSEYFKTKGENPEIEKKIECISLLLTELDFSFLRTRFPDLTGNTDKDVTLCIDSFGCPRIYIDGEEITF